MPNISPITQNEEMKSFLLELNARMMQMTPVERAYRVIKAYVMDENVDDKAYTMFHVWLLDEENKEAKDEAFGRVFEEFWTNHSVAVSI
jgi:hypothetical protein